MWGKYTDETCMLQVDWNLLSAAVRLMCSEHTKISGVNDEAGRNEIGLASRIGRSKLTYLGLKNIRFGYLDPFEF